MNSLAVTEMQASESASVAVLAPWMTVTIAFMVSLITVILALVGYNQFGPKPQRIATVDISEIVQIKEIQLTAMSAKVDATDKDRAAAYDEIAIFGKALETAIADLQQDCNCLLLVRNAVVKGGDDLTGALKQKIGLGNVSLPDAMAALRAGKAMQKPAEKPLEKALGAR